MLQALRFIFFLAIWFVGLWLVRQQGSWVGLAIIGPTLGFLVLFRSRTARLLLRPSPRALLLGIGAGALMILLTWMFYQLSVKLYPPLVYWTQELYALLHAPRFNKLEVMALIPVVACSEELVFRCDFPGFSSPVNAADRSAPISYLAFRFSIARDGWWLPVLINAILTGAMHLVIGSWLLCLIAFACALYWGTLRTLSRSALPNLMAHVLWDLTFLIFWPLT